MYRWEKDLGFINNMKNCLLKEIQREIQRERKNGGLSGDAARTGNFSKATGKDYI